MYDEQPCHRRRTYRCSKHASGGVLEPGAGHRSSMTTTSVASATPLADTLAAALRQGDECALIPLTDAAPHSARDRFTTLLAIYALHTAPLDEVGEAARFQHHPVIAALKQRCEQAWLEELTAIELPDGIDTSDPIGAMRALAARDRLPAVYKWLARSASWDEVVTFLALGGGTDAGLHNLGGACQAGMFGSSKMA